MHDAALRAVDESDGRGFANHETTAPRRLARRGLPSQAISRRLESVKGTASSPFAVAKAVPGLRQEIRADQISLATSFIKPDTFRHGIFEKCFISGQSSWVFFEA
jgi:hypothetical protein